MKRFFICTLLVVSSIISFAQDGLNGKWTSTMSAMGMTATDVMIFNGEQSGTVIEKGTLFIKMNMFGINTTGTSEAYAEGTFTFDGSKLVIKWNKDKASFKMVKPITVVYKGEVVDDPKMKKDFQDMFDDQEKEFLKSLEGDDIYTNVQIKGDKLSWKYIDDEGKTQTEKYTRVK